MYGKYHDGKSCWKHRAWRFINGTLLVIAATAALLVLCDLQQKLHGAEAQALQATKEHDKLAIELQIEIEEKKKIAETWQKQKRDWDNERQLMLDEFEQKKQEADQKTQEANAQIEIAEEEMNGLRLELARLRDRQASVSVSPIPAGLNVDVALNSTTAANDTTVVIPTTSGP